MKSAVYPGSFDPPTNGHLDIILRAEKFFDKLYILVAKSYEKSSLFSAEERVSLLKEVLGSKSEKVEILFWSGLTVDFVKKFEVDCIVRGVRSSVDFRAEQTLANVNHKLYKGCETLLFCCLPEYRDVSSRMVKEIATYGGVLDAFVPKSIEEALKNKLRKS